MLGLDHPFFNKQRIQTMKIRQSVAIILFLTFSSALVVSCGGGSGGDGGTTTPQASLGKISISDAESVFIAPASSSASASNSNAASASTSSVNKLFKITPDGAVLEVEYTDKNGNTITQVNTPVSIYTVNEDYLIFCFGINDINKTDAYLTRKSDGAVFSLTELGLPYKMNNYYLNQNVIQTDSSGNFYFSARDNNYNNDARNVIRVNFQDPSNLLAQIVSPVEESIGYFAVNNGGSFAYIGRLKTEISGSRSKFRIKLNNGGFSNLPVGTDTFWIGLDDNIYYRDLSVSQIQKVTIDPFYNVSTSPYGSPISVPWPYNSYKISINGQIYIISTGSSPQIVRVYDASTDIQNIDIGMSSINRAVASLNFYYVAGNDLSNQPVIRRVNPADDTTSDLYTPGLYDIYEMTTSDNDVIVFNGLRMSDGVIVIGKITADGTISILNETINSQVTTLENIK